MGGVAGLVGRGGVCRIGTMGNGDGAISKGDWRRGRQCVETKWEVGNRGRRGDAGEGEIGKVVRMTVGNLIGRGVGCEGQGGEGLE